MAADRICHQRPFVLHAHFGIVSRFIIRAIILIYISSCLSSLLPESMRWLVSKSREAEAKKILDFAAKMNKIELKELPPKKTEPNSDTMLTVISKCFYLRLNLLK